MDDTGVAGELRAFLGEERFRRFVGQIRTIAAGDTGKLYPWHVRVLDDFDATRRNPLPRSPRALAQLVTGAIPSPPALAEDQVPEWLRIDELLGKCPVQGHGAVAVGGVGDAPVPEMWAWYFRARGEHWSITAVAKGLDPVDIPTDPKTGFHYEEHYESRTSEYDAGEMPLDAARYYIARELGRLRGQRRASE